MPGGACQVFNKLQPVFSPVLQRVILLKLLRSIRLLGRLNRLPLQRKVKRSQMLKWCPKQSHQHWGCETMDSVSTLDENIFNFYFDRVIEGVDGLHRGGRVTVRSPHGGAPLLVVSCSSELLCIHLHTSAI